MEMDYSNEEIIEVLLKHLPVISDSTVKITDRLISIVIKEQDFDYKKIGEEILAELDEVLPNVDALNSYFPLKDARNSEDTTLKMYHKSIMSILKGLSMLLKWLREEERGEEEIKLIIDELFDGAQSLLALVDLLVDNSAKEE